MFGTNYFDTHDNCDNEDIYRFDLNTFQIEPYMRGSFVEEFPEYADHHRAAQPFLRKPPAS